MWLDSTYTEGELKMKAKVFTRIIYVIVAGIFLFSAGKLIYHYGDSYLSEKEFDDLKTNNQYELKQLKKKNKDLVGRIKIKGTKIDYPVMQTPNDPQYYLRRNFEKKYSLSGTPFLDAASTLGKSKNYLIHAHNMKTDTMFNNLPCAADSPLCRSACIFTISIYSSLV